MKRFEDSLRNYGLRVAIMIFVFVLAGNVYAAEEGGNWRSTYDDVMLWINFLILVFLFIKFAKDPIKKYLKGQQDELAEEIGDLERQREDMLDKIKNATEEMEEGNVRLEGIRERIITDGEKRKQAIIEDAKEQSQLMMEDAKRKIEAQILTAKENFRGELIDQAVTLAMEKLPALVNKEDNEKLIEQYLATAATK